MTREQEEALAQVAHDLYEWENRVERGVPVPAAEWRNFDRVLLCNPVKMTRWHRPIKVLLV